MHPYLLVSASMLEENAAEAVQLLRELLTQGRYDETDRIGETVMQNDYFMRQSLISNGHAFAVTKSLSAFSAGAALKETLEGETFVRWFAALAAGFAQNGTQVSAALRALTEKVFVTSRLFAGYSGALDAGVLAQLIAALPRARSARRLRTSAMTRPPVRSRSRRMLVLRAGTQPLRPWQQLLRHVPGAVLTRELWISVEHGARAGRCLRHGHERAPQQATSSATPIVTRTSTIRARCFLRLPISSRISRRRACRSTTLSSARSIRPIPCSIPPACARVSACARSRA